MSSEGETVGCVESESVVSVAKGEETLWKNRLSSYLSGGAEVILIPLAGVIVLQPAPLALALALFPGSLERADLIL